MTLELLILFHFTEKSVLSYKDTTQCAGWYRGFRREHGTIPILKELWSISRHEEKDEETRLRGQS
jgi:hypothetical protein